jgi:hypothetical protein
MCIFYILFVGEKIIQNILLFDEIQIFVREKIIFRSKSKRSIPQGGSGIRIWSKVDQIRDSSIDVVAHFSPKIKIILESQLEVFLQDAR